MTGQFFIQRLTNKFKKNLKIKNIINPIKYYGNQFHLGLFLIQRNKLAILMISFCNFLSYVWSFGSYSQMFSSEGCPPIPISTTTVYLFFFFSLTLPINLFRFLNNVF